MLNREGPVALYEQVAAAIRSRIAGGELRPGHQAPSEHQIMAEFTVSRITATSALRKLREEGLLYSVKGVGTFVGPEDAPRVTQAGTQYQRIAGEIAERIRGGQLQPQMPIPSETTLRQQYGVAKGTVRQAVALLREQGWVFTVSQRGTYVSDPEKWPQSPEGPGRRGEG